MADILGADSLQLETINNLVTFLLHPIPGIRLEHHSGRATSGANGWRTLSLKLCLAFSSVTTQLYPIFQSRKHFQFDNPLSWRGRPISQS